MKRFKPAALMTLALLFGACQSALLPQWGNLYFQVEFPPRAFRLSLVKPETELVGIAVMAPGSSSPLAFRQVNRNQNSVVIDKLVVGPKELLSFALDSKGQILTGNLMNVTVLPGGTSRVEMNLSENFQNLLNQRQRQLLQQLQSQLALTLPTPPQPEKPQLPQAPEPPSAPPSAPPTQNSPIPKNAVPSLPGQPPSQNTPTQPPLVTAKPEVKATDIPDPAWRNLNLQGPTPSAVAPTPVPTPTPVSVGGGSASLGVEVTIITGPLPPITVN
jgi:hypothetical protein